METQAKPRELRALVLTLLELVSRPPRHALRAKVLAGAAKPLKRYYRTVYEDARRGVWLFVYLSLEDLYRRYKSGEIVNAADLQSHLLVLSQQYGVPISEDQLDELVPAQDEIKDGAAHFAEKACALLAGVSWRTIHNWKMRDRQVRWRPLTRKVPARRARALDLLHLVVEALLEAAGSPPWWWRDERDEIRAVSRTIKKLRSVQSLKRAKAEEDLRRGLKRDGLPSAQRRRR